jgi:hypothetical protein
MVDDIFSWWTCSALVPWFIAIQIDPPPAGLATDQRFVFDELSKFVRDTKKADRQYLEASKSRAGRFISVDLARQLSPAFSTWDGRVRHTPSTGRPAGAYAHDLLFRTLRGELRHIKVRKLLVSAGGAGSGKTTSLGKVTDQSSVVYFDNQLRRYQTARRILETALANDWTVQVVYIHRPFEDVVRAVLERSQRTGRWNSTSELAESHVEAQTTIIRLRDEYQGRIGFVASFNASRWWTEKQAGLGASEVGARVDFRKFRAGGAYHLADASTLRSKVEKWVRQAIEDRIVCEEVAALVRGS